MTTETHAILYQSADGTLSLGMKCKTPECAAESVPLFEGAKVLGTVALLPEPVSGMSYRLAAQPLIAELGQEVGAVADDAALREFTEYFVKNYPGPHTIIMDPNWHAPRIFRAAKRALRTSPAHTSEARDWEGVEHVASHIENAVDYITKQYPDARMLDRAPIMRNMRRWARNLRAAMRQEAE